MLGVTVALATSKELLTALVKPLASLAVNCLPVPAMLTLSPEKATVPLPAPVPISSEVAPWSEPVPALRLRLRLRLRGRPTVESLQNESFVWISGCARRRLGAGGDTGW